MHVKRVINKSNQEITTNAMLKLDNIKKDSRYLFGLSPRIDTENIEICYKIRMNFQIFSAKDLEAAFSQP